MKSPEETAAHLSGLLGDDAKALSFISEFNTRRFTASAKAAVPKANESSRGSRQESVQHTAKKNSGNGLLSSDLGSKGTKASSQQVPSQGVKSVEIGHSPHVKISTLADIDTALQALELHSDSTSRTKEVSCDCQARRHGLNQVSPNCLSCGKIICQLESISTCSFCHASLLSQDQKAQMIAELKRERGVEKTARNNANQGRRSQQAANQKIGYAGKVGANFTSSEAQTLQTITGAKIESSTDAAIQRKNDLLDHVRSGAKRTVIDQASDFQSLSTNKWSDPEHRAIALRRHLAQVKAEKEAEGGGRRVLSINIGGGAGKSASAGGGKGKGKVNRVEVVNEKQKIRSADELDAGISVEQDRVDQEARRKRAEQEELDARVAASGALSRSIVLGDLPKLVLPDSGVPVRSDGWYKTSKWRRVQDDEEENALVI